MVERPPFGTMKINVYTYPNANAIVCIVQLLNPGGTLYGGSGYRKTLSTGVVDCMADLPGRYGIDPLTGCAGWCSGFGANIIVETYL